MNLVFLDIDGVLNNLGSAMGLGSTSRYFDPVSVALVDRLCREGHAQIVVSSSWRNGDTDRLMENLERCGQHVITYEEALKLCEDAKDVHRVLAKHAPKGKPGRKKTSDTLKGNSGAGSGIAASTQQLDRHKNPRRSTRGAWTNWPTVGRRTPSGSGWTRTTRREAEYMVDNDLSRFTTQELLAEVQRRMEATDRTTPYRCATCGSELRGEIHYCSGAPSLAGGTPGFV